MRTPLIAGNWKMNLTTEDSEFPEETFIENITKHTTDNVEVAIFPPFTHIGLLSAINDDRCIIGGQDISAYENGVYTGDVSAECLIDVGASYVLTGHNERREKHDENNAIVRRKSEIALSAGLNVIVCIGESLDENKAGKTLYVLQKQLDESIPQGAMASSVVVAYEPVWAIGTGLTPSEADVESVHKALRMHLNASRGVDFADSVRIVYGGSVKGRNAKSLLSLENVDGVLVGGASLNSKDFIAIIDGLK